MDRHVLASFRTHDPLIDSRCASDPTNNGRRLATLKFHSLGMFRIIRRKTLRKDTNNGAARSERKYHQKSKCFHF